MQANGLRNDRYKKKLGSILKEEREKQRISQQQLSRISTLTQGEISRIEAGILMPKIYTLKIICDSLNISILYVIKKLFNLKEIE
jgi:transcriptional regulator with XRE-family HTH domain